MKRKLLSVALLAVLSVGLVTACNNDDDVVDEDEYSISITNKAELQEAWYLGDSARSVSVELTPTGNPTSEIASGALTVESSAPTVIAATGLSLTAQGLGDATITVNWHGASDSVALSVMESSYDSIASINAGLKAGTIKDGDTVRFYGKVIGSMEQSTTHLYSGVYLGDGDESLMLYSGNISSVFFEDGEQVISLGDDIAVAADVSAYNGFYEFKPTYVVPLDSLVTPYTVTAPIVTTLTEAGWNALTYTNVGNLIEMELTYVSGTVSTAASTHSTINCTIGDGDEKSSVALYVNYHIGTDEVSALADMINNLDEGDALTVTGVVGWYNGPEICPNFIYVSGEELAPSECVTIAPKPGTESLSITGDGITETEGVKTLEVEKYFSAELGVSVDQGADKSVTWSVTLPSGSTSELSAEDILSISSSGKVHGLAEGTVIVTATAVKAGATSGVQASDSVTVTVGPLAHETPFSATSGENEYYFGMASDDDWAYYLINGDYIYNSSNEPYLYEGAVTTVLDEAVKVSVNACEGSDRAFTLSFTLNEETYYIAIVTSGTHINMNYVKEETPIYWSYELGCWTNEDEDYFLCYNSASAYSCLYCSAVSSYYGSSPLALLTTEEEISEFLAPIEVELATTITSGETYYLGYDAGDDGLAMFNGTAYSSYELYVSYVDHANKWVGITLTLNSDETTYTLSFTDSNGETQIIYGYESGNYGDLYYGSEDDVTEKSGTSAFAYDATAQTLSCTIGENSYFIGVDAKYATEITICASGATNTPCHLYSLKAASEVEPA